MAMRIGIDVRLWSESGVGRYIRNLVLHLQKLDKQNEYRLFAIKKDLEGISSIIKNKQVQTVEADVRWHTLSEQIKFKQIIDRQNIDLMHFPYFSVPYLYNGPFVVTIHDLILHHFPTGEASTLFLPVYRLKHKGYSFIISNAAKKSEHIITVSEATKEEIVDHLKVPSTKISVTYEGVDENIQKAKVLKKSIIDSPYFLHVGNLYPHKNMERFIKAFHTIVKGENRNVKLVIVGKKDFFYENLIKKMRNLGVDEETIFMGEVTDSELATLYYHALATVIPSLMEGFGLPALEAMSKGGLVLASETPSLREICDNVALYFEPTSIEDMEQKMKDILKAQKGQFDKYREIGMVRAQEYSWKKCVEETLAVYEKVKNLKQV